MRVLLKLSQCCEDTLYRLCLAAVLEILVAETVKGIITLLSLNYQYRWYLFNVLT